VCFSSFPPGIYKGHCFRINHFPEDNDYDHDSSEYLLRECQELLPSFVYGRELGGGGRGGHSFPFRNLSLENGVLCSTALTGWVSWWSCLADRPLPLGDGGLGGGGGVQLPRDARCGQLQGC
jgi:hypothetical protein